LRYLEALWKAEWLVALEDMRAIILHSRQHAIKHRSFATRVSQLKIWHFLVIGIERNV